tara:strand:+ start:399 stop:1061 length:663 start_codon:yes stop_codon:yes gene_type:complete
MKIYCFSGLGADERVFSLLKLSSPYELIPVDWIHPIHNESLEEYSRRISETIYVKKPFGILGVSFGGLIAQEISTILKPSFTIVISSIHKKAQIPLLLKFTPNFLLNRIPSPLFKLPLPVANYVFGAQNKKLLHQILKDTDYGFVKWALFAFKNWKANNEVLNTCFICGEKDRMLKPLEGCVEIANGGHFMVVDLAQEVSCEINSFLKEFNDVKSSSKLT